MDDQIAPVDNSGSGGDPIASYRAYLESQTGNRSGAGPSMDQPPPDQGSGAGPMIAPVTPNAAPQAGSMGAPGGGSTPIMDSVLGNPIAPVGDAPQADQADQADQAPKAKKAAKAKGARQAEQADQIAPVRKPMPAGQSLPDQSLDNSAAPGPAPSPSGPGAPIAPGAPSPASGSDITTDDSKMTPASGHVIKGEKTEDGRPMIGIHPPDHSPDDFDEEKLKNAHNAADILDALNPKSRTKYMDWWEQQHGDINKRFDQMKAELGQRPDPNREPTRQEKFAELMQFGLHLLQNAKRGNDPAAAMGASAEEALQGQKAKQQQQTADYDKQALGIESQRQNQLKDIGNYGNAVREDALITNANVRTAGDVAKMLAPPKAGQPQTRYDAKGNMYTWKPTADDPNKMDWIDQNGDPLKPGTKMQVQGPRGGVGAGGTSKQLQLIQALEARGYKPADAVNSVLKIKPSGDPFHDYVSVLNKNTPQGATAEEKAEAAQMAQETVDHMYGPGALDAARARRNGIINGPGSAPPTSALKPGVVTKFKNGQRWTLDANGQPKQVM